MDELPQTLKIKSHHDANFLITSGTDKVGIITTQFCVSAFPNPTPDSLEYIHNTVNILW